MSQLSIAMPQIKIEGIATSPVYSGKIEDVEFGRHFTPNFFLLEYEDGAWQTARLGGLHNLSLHPAATVFHYSQSLIEGLKAFRQQNGDVVLFRPIDNARRLNKSARRLDMPEIDESYFVQALSQLVDVDRDHVLPSPASLYLRPTMFGSEPLVKLASSSKFIFFVIGAVTGPYFKGTSGRDPGSLKVFVSRTVARASAGGTGHIKAGANYAITLQVTSSVAKEFGCHQVLFLDAKTQQNIEEMGGMNIFFVRDGKLITPRLDHDTILEGVTRDSVKTIAREELRMPVLEEDLSIDEMLADFESGRISEAIACGTAASVASIGEFCVENPENPRAPKSIRAAGPIPGPVTTQLFKRLRGIQYGESPDPYGWVHIVRKGTRA